MLQRTDNDLQGWLEAVVPLFVVVVVLTFVGSASLVT